MLKILVFVLIFPLALMADDVSEVISKEKNNLKEPAAAKPTLPQAQSYKEDVNCLNAINQQNPITTKEYAEYKGNHFVFKKGSFTYLKPDGQMYSCAMNGPTSAKGKNDFQFTLNNQVMQPFGPSKNNVGDVTSTCSAASSQSTNEMYNQVVTNLRKYGAQQKLDGSTRAQAMKAIKSGCAKFQDASRIAGEAFDQTKKSDAGIPASDDNFNSETEYPGQKINN